MRRPGWAANGKPGRRWAPIGLLTVAVVASLAVATPGVQAGPRGERPPTSPLLDGNGHRNKDNRAGAAAPSARQRSLAGRAGVVRFNRFGTPEAIGPVKSLAGGLSKDPETAARQYLNANRDLFGLDTAAVAGLERIAVHPIGAGAVVLLRQRFGDLRAGPEGLVSVLVKDGTVVRVTSSLSRDTRAPQPATLTGDDAVRIALADAGLTADQAARPDVRQVAVPTPTDGPRAAYAVTLTATDTEHPASYTTYVDARSGTVLIREDLVDFDSDNPRWAVFPATAPVDGADTRVQWCGDPAPGCVEAFRDPAGGQPWDVDLATGTPTFTSRGNAAVNTVSWGAGTPATPATASPTRDYVYPFTDQWQRARCNPAVFASAQRNDGDAAVSNLFAMHNRMHDWSYHLGFTESAWNMQVVNVRPGGLGGDPEQGRAQSNALGGSRNNANQNSPSDGLPPTTNMFLWQPVAGGAYPPCVDGDFDMSVIGHEYTHAITNRMIAGPNARILSDQGNAMGEAWSDLVAAEYLFENGYRAPGNTPFVTGGYVTGNTSNGIRNYDGSRSPLNYSDVGYDLVGPQVHADGEIWVATNLRVRAALIKKYGPGSPSLQKRCAAGAVPVDACPGNRRWVQLMFDSFLLQASSLPSMVDMRDNMLAADLARFDGANQEEIWGAFAESGLGRDAASGPNDADPTPSFASPHADNATVTLRPLGDAAGAVVRLYVGDYEARATPVADTDPTTALPDTFQIVPRTPFRFVANGPGLGSHRFTRAFPPGRGKDLPLNLPRNLASTAGGATVSGDGINLERIADDTEATNWASRDGVAGKQVTVDLAGDQPHQVTSVNVSTLLRPAVTGDPDAGGQNRFTALRSFAVLACDATVADCTTDAGFRQVYTSPADAFPGGAFRPVAPQLALRSFGFAATPATHLRIQVLTSQCTGNPRYAGEQDDDPAAGTDCATNSPFAAQVRISEFQAFTR